MSNRLSTLLLHNSHTDGPEARAQVQWTHLDIKMGDATVVQVLHDIQGLLDVLRCQKLIKVLPGADVLEQPALGDAATVHPVPT